MPDRATAVVAGDDRLQEAMFATMGAMRPGGTSRYTILIDDVETFVAQFSDDQVQQAVDTIIGQINVSPSQRYDFDLLTIGDRSGERLAAWLMEQVDDVAVLDPKDRIGGADA